LRTHRRAQASPARFPHRVGPAIPGQACGHGFLSSSTAAIRFARFDFGVAGLRTRILICPIPLLRWPRMYHSRLRTPRADGRKRPLHGNTHAHPFDISPVGVTLNVMRIMYRFCYRRFGVCLRKSTDRVLALIVPGKCHPPSNSAARETYVALAAYAVPEDASAA
jgi:hypothetical protein